MRGNERKTVYCRQIHGELVEVPVSELSFRPSVYGVTIKDSTVLLVPQWEGYDFPGGAIEPGETLADALVREVKEETGYEVRPGKLLTLADNFFIHPARGTAHHSILMYFACEVTGGALSDSGFSAHERAWSKLAEWVPLEKISGLTFFNPVNSPALIEAARGR